MSTRGLIGFRVDGKDYLTYNHSDSYPTWMGPHLIETYLSPEFPKGEELKDKVRALRLVDAEENPTPDDVARFSEYYDSTVGGFTEQVTWYQLLRRAQGDLDAYLTAGVMIDYHDFINDSLFCEWAYVFNLDDEVLEIYKGFNGEDRAKHTGRYAENAVPQEGYLPCYLVAKVDLNVLDTVDVDFCQKLELEGVA